MSESKSSRPAAELDWDLLIEVGYSPTYASCAFIHDQYESDTITIVWVNDHADETQEID